MTGVTYDIANKPRLIRNSIQTPDGTILTSYHRHDYVTHQDANGKHYMTDGGLSYIRRSMNGDEISLDLYDDEPHEVQRKVLTWGTYGKDGKQPLRRVAIADMETDHLEAVLRECHPSLVFKNCMMKELRGRDVP